MQNNREELQTLNNRLPVKTMRKTIILPKSAKGATEATSLLPTNKFKGQDKLTEG